LLRKVLRRIIAGVSQAASSTHAVTLSAASRYARRDLPRRPEAKQTAIEMTSRRSIGDYLSQQRRMVSIGARYTRFVALLKVALPVGAAALAASVIVWPYLDGPEVGFRLAFTEVGASPSKGIRMTNVRFFDSDGNDQPISVTAEAVTQDTNESDIVRFTMPTADIELRSGVWLALTAQQGELNRSEETLSLDGSVNLFSDQGYELRTERMELDLRSRSATGNAPVEGQGPLGLLNADRFRVEPGGGSIHFEGQVRMVVYPKAGV
jgi:lipopolysaccharide export system protein LptC